jgi:hypothetical protein
MQSQQQKPTLEHLSPNTNGAMNKNSSDLSACAVGCVVTGNYTPHAKMLYNYIATSNPSLRFVALVIGERERLASKLPTGPEWIFWDELFSNQERLDLASKYTAFELSCVARGRLHEFLWDQNKAAMWVVLDTDMIVLSNLGPLWKELSNYTGIVTPHLSKPGQSAERELNSLNAGVYNAGFLAFRRCDESIAAIKWLKNRLENYGYASLQRREKGLTDPHGFLFVDQIWLNFLPSYFEGILARGLPEWNLGHWNLIDGALTKDTEDEEYLYDGRVVMIAHLSGVPIENPEYVSIHAPWYREFPDPVWADLARDYLVKLGEASKASLEIGYCYRDLAPDTRQRQKENNEEMPGTAVLNEHKRNFPNKVLKKVARGLHRLAKSLEA